MAIAAALAAAADVEADDGAGFDEVGSRWSDEGPGFDLSRPFDPARWRAGTPLWRSVFAPPALTPAGYVASFGEDARRLLTEHWNDRLQIAVRPDDNTSVRACVDHRAGASGAEHRERAVATVDVTISEGPLDMSVALFGNGSNGRVRANAVLQSKRWPRAAAFGTVGVALDQPLLGQAGAAAAGVAVNERNFRGAVVARSGDSVGEIGAQLEGHAVVRMGAVQVGVDAAVAHVGEDGDHRVARLERSGAPTLAFGDDVWAVRAATLRAVYSGASARRFTGEPESYQVGASVEGLGERLVASYFRHLAVRESSAMRPYWRGISFGGEFVQQRETEFQSAGNMVALGAQWQVAQNVALKARGITDGTCNIAAAVRGRNVLGLFPSIEVVLSAGVNLFRLGTRPSFGMSCVIGE